MLRAAHYRGTITIKGQAIDAIASLFLEQVPKEATARRKERDGDRFHMTVVTSDEMKQSDIDLESYCQKYSNLNAEMVGLAVLEKGAQQSWYVVMYSTWASKFRSHFGLPHREFHVSLGFYGEDLYGSGSLYHCIRCFADRDSVFTLVNNVIEDTGCEALSQADLDQKLFILHHASELLIARGSKLLAEHVKVLRSIANWCLKACFENSVDIVLDIGYCLFRRGIPYGLYLVILARIDIWESCSMNGNFPQRVLSGAKFETMALVLRDCNILIAERSKAAQNNGSGTAWSYYDPVFAVDPKEKSINVGKVPRNFSWVTLDRCDLEGRLLPYLLAGSAYPTTREQMVALRNVGIQHILTVHEAALPPTLCPTIEHSAKSAAFDLVNHRASDNDLGIVSYHFDVVDRTPPTQDQLQSMCEIIRRALARSEGVLVHCQGGVGRTNTVIIAYLMWSQHLSASDATARVTEQRKIILSQSQKLCLQRWWSICVEDRENRATVLPSMPLSVPCVTTFKSPVEPEAEPTNISTVQNSAVPMYRSIATAIKLPPLIVLCGYAASGKSTFAKALVAASPYFVRINKDEMRGKGECENTLFDAITAINANSKKSGGRPGRTVETIGINPVSHEAGAVVIDCCNLSAAKRSEWVKLAHSPRAWCVYFNIPLEQCKERIQSRRGHPTILSGEAGVRILGSMQRMLEPPNATTARKEGFERLIVLNNEQEVADLMSSWKIPFPTPDSLTTEPAEATEENDELLKFPRTSHIMNLGAATRDDKILGESDLAALLGPKHTVVVEEKLDGANMGIFIHSREQKIMVQNRSHFISSKYHAQFGPLDRWLEQHSADLWTILTPGRHILYGEWLHATHSVKYTHLPGWFVAYDLYDRMTGTFASRAVLAELLATTSIPHVPLIYEGSINTVEELKSMVTGTSKFNHTQREGIVVRVCQGGKLISRAKLVRADFIAGNERWNKSIKLETNILSTTEK